MKIQSRRSVVSDGWAIVFSLSLPLTRCRVEIGGILENLRAHSQRRAATDDLSFYLQRGNKLNQITRQTGKEPPPSLTRESCSLSCRAGPRARRGWCGCLGGRELA